MQKELIFEGDDQTAAVLSALHKGGEMHIDNIAIALNLSVHELSTLIFQLEMNGQIKALPGNFYSLA